MLRQARARIAATLALAATALVALVAPSGAADDATVDVVVEANWMPVDVSADGRWFVMNDIDENRWLRYDAETGATAALAKGGVISDDGMTVWSSVGAIPGFSASCRLERETFGGSQATVETALCVNGEVATEIVAEVLDMIDGKVRFTASNISSGAVTTYDFDPTTGATALVAGPISFGSDARLRFGTASPNQTWVVFQNTLDQGLDDVPEPPAGSGHWFRWNTRTGQTDYITTMPFNRAIPFVGDTGRVLLRVSESAPAAFRLLVWDTPGDDLSEAVTPFSELPLGATDLPRFVDTNGDRFIIST